MQSFNTMQRSELWHIVYRNVFLLTNEIVFVVVCLLCFFGQYRAGVFLGLISLVNVVVNLTQDIHAWRSLEKLQMLTAQRVVRINPDGTTESVLAEEIQKGDRIVLKTGDQVPCDCIVMDALGLEINEGLITGESNSVSQKPADRLLAGSIVTAGQATVQAKTVFHESRIARMTDGIKQHSEKSSPIQQSANDVIRYAGYLLIVSIFFVIVRGVVIHEPAASVVLTIGTLSSMLVPQGLIFALTIFFAYGAANLFRKNVLLQEINATEKLGRIKNLCMDKTGTLTENGLVVEEMHLPTGGSMTESKRLVAAYVYGTQDDSQVIRAVRDFLHEEEKPTVVKALPFSAWRQYGAVQIKQEKKDLCIFVGPSDVFLPHLQNRQQTAWLEKLLQKHQRAGKHVLCVVQMATKTIPNNLNNSQLAIVAVLIFQNTMREGITDTIRFFQNRGVRIRILSGDHPETTQAVAIAAGIQQADKIITGPEMANWSADEYATVAEQYTIFARIVPEQKEHIIEGLKKHGFTAMVGDGANDALAIKKADLGIAMFDGSQATRKLAAIVLVNNSFTALPGGVQLADDIIRNIEIFAGIFFNQTLIGLFLFIFLSLFGYAYPLTPFNVTLINYCTIGFPGVLISYWTLWPKGKIPPVRPVSFLRRIFPFAFLSAIVQSAGVGIVFALSQQYLRGAQLNTVVTLAFIPLSFLFFVDAPTVYRSVLGAKKRTQIAILALSECLLLSAVFFVPPLVSFFTIAVPHLSAVHTAQIIGVVGVFCIMQYLLATFFYLDHVYKKQK